MSDETPESVRVTWFAEMCLVRDSFADTIAEVDRYAERHGVDDQAAHQRAQAERRAKLREMQERIALLERASSRSPDLPEDAEDLAYTNGHRRAIAGMLGYVLRELYSERSPDDWQLEVARLQKERLETVNALRDVCSKHGDNDWSEDLHLSDVIEKHLGRHLEKP